MRTSTMITFLSIVLTIYISGNTYILIRGLQALPQSALMRIIYSVIILFPATAFIIGEVGEKTGLFQDNHILIFIGSLWLAFLLYAVLFTLTIDLIRAVNYFINFLPDKEWMLNNNIPLKLMGAVTVLTGTIFFTGFVIASSPIVKTIDLEINKKSPGLDSLNIVMASDIHLGNIVGANKFSRLVNTINTLDPDIVLFPGDIFDENLKPVIKNNHGDIMKSIKAHHGVFAVTGNHEYIGGVNDAVAFLQKHGVTILRDKAVVIGNAFILVGREDLSISRFSDKKRNDLATILENTNTDMPVILMDHQPYSIDESAKEGVDLHLSGHTHNGQLWPFNYITRALYEISHGYKKIKNTHVYVSNGYGTWGPPVRTTGRPEVVNIKVKFNRKK
ncbi:MAG: metallophosphoesterase [Spirochaetota bacterium]